MNRLDLGVMNLFICLSLHCPVLVLTFFYEFSYSLLAAQIDTAVLGRSNLLRVRVKFSVVLSFLQAIDCKEINITDVYNTIHHLHRLSGLRLLINTYISYWHCIFTTTCSVFIALQQSLSKLLHRG